MKNLDLLSNTSRVETPFIKVTIGDYTFGVYDKKAYKGGDINGAYRINHIKYPNYVKRLNVEKINGTVNKYNLEINYPITERDDPNFFEKVFSSVSKTRKIVFSYGDLSMPTFVYRNEEAIITNIDNNFNIPSVVITYTISAISTGSLLKAGAFSFRERYAKPSDVIKELLYNKNYGLQEIFYGMVNRGLVERENLILSDDKKVRIEMKSNISILDYLNYLIDCMTPCSTGNSDLIKNAIYIMTVIDDTSGVFGGPYFKIIRSDQIKDMSSAYEIDIGFPSQNIVTGFRVNNNESYSILYEFMSKLKPEQYVQRINDEGEIEEVYAPIISSGTFEKKTNEAERTWWTKVTQYPIKASITLKGLLRPAILMTHVRLNVYFYGKRHISSGLYIVTKQQDTISEQGFQTNLNLVRIGGAEI